MIGSVSLSRRAHAFAQALTASQADEGGVGSAPEAEPAAPGPTAVPTAENRGDIPRHPEATPAAAEAAQATEPAEATPRPTEGSPGTRPGAAPREPGARLGRAGPGQEPERGEQAAMLSVAHRLAALPRPALRAEAKAEQRALLLARVTELAGAADAPASAEPGAPDAAGPTEPGSAAPRPAADSTLGDRVPSQRRTREGRGAHRAPPLGPFERLRPKSRLSKGLAAGGLTVGVAASAFGGVAAASGDALPGDRLYGLKRGMEDLRLDLAGSDASRGRVLLDHASTRLHEARRLLERGRTGPLSEEHLGEIRQTLVSMRDDAAAGHQLLADAHAADGSMDPIRSLSTFTENHRGAWQELRQQLPHQLWDVSREVTSVFDAMDDDVIPLRRLLPEEPERASATAHHEAAPTPPSAATERQPTESSAPEEAPAPPPAGEEAGSTSAEESPPEGLLQQVPRLLDPSPGPDDTAEPGETEPEPEGPRLPRAELTVPPLVEDLLPRLGLRNGGTDEE